jgi:hypothetical protein
MRFEIHQLDRDGSIRKYIFNPKTYSLYVNGMTYDRTAAEAHLAEIQSKHPFIQLVIIDNSIQEIDYGE